MDCGSGATAAPARSAAEKRQHVFDRIGGADGDGVTGADAIALQGRGDAIDAGVEVGVVERSTIANQRDLARTTLGVRRNEIGDGGERRRCEIGNLRLGHGERLHGFVRVAYASRSVTEFPMDLDYSPDELAFRDDVRAWLRAHLSAALRDKVTRYGPLTRDDLVRWHRILAAQGWIAPAWPTEWGGTGWSVVQRYIFEEECGYAGAPPIVPFGLLMCGPVLLKFGTDAQKKRFLPRIYRGDDFWCQGYSEPGSGSDLASLRTTAVRHGDRYVVNGQKTWTTLAHMADWIFCLVRTGADSDRRQDGISFLLIDMKTPGHHRAAARC